MARQASGQAWDGDEAYPGAPAERCRQPFYPDASRVFEEIDRLGLAESGIPNLLAAKADFDFYRPAPSGGYTRGLSAAERSDVGHGDIPPERLGEHFFPYRPWHVYRQPPKAVLARITNMVQRALASGDYAGAIWLEGSPRVEETIYWLSLLIDTTVPIVGNAAQRPHGQVSNDGDRNIIDAVDYIVSGIWADANGRDRIGAVLAQDERVFAAREVQKADARPGGYTVTGGHGGLVASMGDPGPPALTFIPARRHTSTSLVSTRHLPERVLGVRREDGRVALLPVQVKDDQGDLLPAAIPYVAIVKEGSYLVDDRAGDPSWQVDVLGQIDLNLQGAPLAGFVLEGLAPYGISTTSSRDAALERAVLSGMPVVTVGRGNNEGFTQPVRYYLGGNNLTATKARLLLMACLLRFGSLPPAADPDRPTEQEQAATRAALDRYQEIFDTH